VTLNVEGERPQLPVGIDLSAYRIVQEGLANALKHVNCEHCEVTVRYGGDGLEVVISDDGSAVNGAGRTEGASLAGMRERVALYGGTLETGQRDGGGCVVRAQLPVETES
jgi:signal transduction histidine kinase